MSSKGYRWYNNGVEEGCYLKCPNNWLPGRLKVSEEIRRKMSESSWTHRATREELNKRNKKISDTIQSRTEEEKTLYSKKISKTRRGKGLGQTPWNKGLHLEPSNKGIPMSEEQKQKLRDIYRVLPEEEKKRRSLLISNNNKDKIPWNKGLTYSLDADTVRKAKLKEYSTKKENNSFNISSLEDKYYQYLCSKYGQDNVIRQYSDDRYPFACDFYIKSEDLFIELNGNWTHGGRPFDSNDELCIKQLNEWKEKAKTSDYYKNAIYTWTNLDIRKKEIANKNKLKYEVIYKKC